jgi:hypothetical protein
MGFVGRFASEPRSIIDIESHPVTTAQRRAGSESSDLRSRLSQLMGEESPERLALRLGEFRRSVHDTLIATSSAYAVLDQLIDSGLKDCAKCTRELEARLAGNAHYIVLGKLKEAEQALAALGR